MLTVKFYKRFTPSKEYARMRDIVAAYDAAELDVPQEITDYFDSTPSAPAELEVVDYTGGRLEVPDEAEYLTIEGALTSIPYEQTEVEPWNKMDTVPIDSTTVMVTRADGSTREARWWYAGESGRIGNQWVGVHGKYVATTGKYVATTGNPVVDWRPL